MGESIQFPKPESELDDLVGEFHTTILDKCIII